MSTTLSAKAWILLLYGLPAPRTSERVNLWRKLKRFGALPLKNSAYVLPDEPRHYERFQWLAEQVRSAGGDATLLRVADIEGLPHEQVVTMFNDARARDYAKLISALRKFIAVNRKRLAASAGDGLEKLQRQFQEIREIDYFDSPAGHDAELMLKQAHGLLAPKNRAGGRLDAKQFIGKTWLTRPRPEIDRAGSAWLIRRFIDPQARFVFAAQRNEHPQGLPFDMADVEFSHHGDDCTFETLVKRFGIEDAAVLQIAEMIHDADLEDEKFGRVECIGLDRVLKGWGRQGRPDEEILSRGFECLDALYEWLREKR